MAKANAHLWSSRPWNSDVGRVVDWIRRWRKSGSYASRQAVRAFYLIAVEEVGELPTRAAVQAAGLDLPAFLHTGTGTEQPAEKPVGEIAAGELAKAA